VALLFFQPSTRTRIGFESAAAALGATAIGVDDMSASRSNARSAETLEDCAAVVSRFSDAIVVRHHESGARLPRYLFPPKSFSRFRSIPRTIASLALLATS
jgi:aspartate carbamoyltransferase catalytic subunit